MESSLSGESTFLKKLKILLFGFAPFFVNAVFLTLDLGKGAFVFELGRGVRGFVEDLEAIVAGMDGRMPLGGVGALPVEGLIGVSAAGLDASRGFRNIVWAW